MLPRFTQTHSPKNQDRLTKQAALTHGLKIEPGFECYDFERAGIPHGSPACSGTRLFGR